MEKEQDGGFPWGRGAWNAEVKRENENEERSAAMFSVGCMD